MTFMHNMLHCGPLTSVSLSHGNTSHSLADENGNTVISTERHENPTYAEQDSWVVAGSSVAAVVYDGDDGSEEMHVFFAMAWFDMESWAWGHYLLEWATQGIFQVCCSTAVMLLAFSFVSCERGKCIWLEGFRRTMGGYC